MSIDLQIALDRPILWKDLLGQVSAALIDLLRVPESPKVAVREWSHGETIPLRGDVLSFSGPLSNYLFEFGSSVSI
jgi:hypothetical protein